jgi:uncharacterized protein
MNNDIGKIVMDGDFDRLKPVYDDVLHKSYRDDQGYTLLMLAADSGSLNCATFLLNKGHSPNDTLDNGISPLWIAVSAGYKEMADLLLNSGAKINAKGDNDSMTPLMIAVSNSDFELIKLLIDRGANKSEKDKHGNDAKSYTSDSKILTLLK